MIESTENGSFRLIKNIFQELRKNNISIFEAQNEIGSKEEVNKFINTDNLNIEQEEDLKYFMKILTTITRTVASEVINKKITREEGEKALRRQLEIVKNGMRK